MNALLDAPLRTSATTQSNRLGLASILYAEDNDALRRLSTLTLTRSGYVVTPVEDGLQAWEALQADRYDLLITDHDMPRLTGLELAAKARREGITLPVLVVSGSVAPFPGEVCARLRPLATLAKPLAGEELVTTVQRLLRSATSGQRGPDIFAPTLGEVWRHIQPWRHWGINE